MTSQVGESLVKTPSQGFNQETVTTAQGNMNAASLTQHEIKKEAGKGAVKVASKQPPTDGRVGM